ncbi:hypothetical protein AK830_g7977 [Neonectria ditissima]|uniref:AAA+ ATPase domain-containing protein n=1 Tax=Neonectria ditissima TaxID=78410 RepID=A0A0P7BDL0_9HYPO|nr:hypothetical protein AK830_g7977 [Neonectria ditissima]
MSSEAPPPEQMSSLLSVEHLNTTDTINKTPDGQSQAGNASDHNKSLETEIKDMDINLIPEALQRLVELNELFSQDKIQENRHRIEQNVNYATMSEAFCRRLMQKNRGLGHLQMRSYQAIMHHNFTALRIDDLEKEVLRLKNRVYGYEHDHTFDVVVNKLVSYRHELRRSSPNDFPLNKESIALPPAQQPALEVLSSRTSIFKGLSQVPERETEGYGTKPMAPKSTEGVSGSFERVCEATPERLRIRSRPLMFHLEKVSESTMMSIATLESDTLDCGKVWSAIVFLRPFKFFTKHEMAIRDSLAEVEAQARIEACEDLESSSNDRQSGKASKADERQFDAKDLCGDLKLLIHFLDVDLKPTFDLRKRIKNGTAVEIEYADLWHLSGRGDIVITRSQQVYARMVVGVAGGREALIPELSAEKGQESVPLDGFTVDCISLGSDGTSYVPKLEKFSIRRFEGRQPISSLTIYPLKFDPRANEIQARFIQEGRSFLDVTRKSFCHKMAKGKTVDEPSHNVDSQVIVDMTLAMNVRPEWRLQSTVSVDELTRQDKRETAQAPWCKHRRHYDACCGSDVIVNDLRVEDVDAQEFIGRTGWILKPLAAEDITEEQVILMRPYVYAFVLRSRQWVTIRSSDLGEVEFENNFADLVVPDNHKTTVQALVKTHENSRTLQSSSTGSSSIGAGLDLVRGKGSGLVILLHGPPGVGKTSTAECVADDTRRPLYPITCGDIGETAAEVEHNLQYNFQLAHKWGCVLLLDEADIFLTSRTDEDLRHNAVTSVFIRSLEYYAGILFLTTNRVGAIDSAFRSRIQMSLFYPSLSLDVTCKLYEKFVNRAKVEQYRKHSHQFKIKEKEILRFGKKHFLSLEKAGCETWNGRQIRNAFQTAIALTEHQCMTIGSEDPRPILGKEKFQTVARGFKQFDEYLYATLGGTDAQLATSSKQRNDDFMKAERNHLMQAVGQVPHYKSDEDTESETDSDEDEDEDEDGKSTGRRTGKSALAAPVKEQNFVTSDAASDMDEFREYLKWKMQSRHR